MNKSDNNSMDLKYKDVRRRRTTDRTTEKSCKLDDTVFVNHDKTRVVQPVKSKKENGAGVGKFQDIEQSGSGTAQYQNPAVDAGQDKTRVKTGSPKPIGADRGAATRPNSKSDNFVLKERFVLEEVLGVGGMGVVHKAKDRLKIEARDKDPYVAIKMLSEEFNAHPDAFIALQRESRKTQRLSHPNIVKVFDFDKDGDVFFMTMEYMAGTPLNRLIKQYSKTGLPWDDVQVIFQGMCSALQYAHAENIIHADFKPGNILVTTNGLAKIFDFGIAKAVTTIEKTDGWPVHQTIFDAASLGGLTPAYASFEMLIGQEPDVRDDIYALGCITYELFTGKHPFNKLQADKARARKLKPKRVNGLKKRQWKALQKALAFDREDRMESVEEFYKQFTATYKPRYMLIASAVVVASVSGLAYVVMENKRVDDRSGVSEQDIRSELKFDIRLELYKEELIKLMADPSFSAVWEENVWKEYQGVGKLLPLNDSWFAETRKNIFSLYLKKVQAEINSSSFHYAQGLIENASRYSNGRAQLDAEKLKLAEAIAMEDAASAVKKLGKKEETRPPVDEYSLAPTNGPRVDEYSLALTNVNKQLKCQGSLNMRDFDIAIKKLRSLGPKKYSKIKNGIIRSLTTCISKLGKTFPDRALESKKYAQRLFGNNSLIASIQISSRDACDGSIAGLGARGERAVCRDLIKDVGYGPELVVVPAGDNIKSFAIGKYEVSIDFIEQYCLETKQCSLSRQGSDNIPLTGLSVSIAKGYLKWLSKKTGQKYRLPTRDEWVYAAASTTTAHDPNRNCQFRSRGIQKGDKLVKITTGKQNSWGLVNYLGNVQEWGYDKSGRLVAMGGAYTHSMDECQIASWQQHSGEADVVTGFRVLRELKNTK